MQEKQTFTHTKGPNKPTHIEMRKANLMRTQGLLAGAALTAAAFGGANMLTHHDEQPDQHVKSVIDVHNEPSFEEVTVQKGDTMWDIAERVNGETDLRDTITSLQEANPWVSPSSIQPGEVLQVPVDISDHDLTK